MTPNMKGKYIVGLDLGGTNVRAAVTDRDGAMLCEPVSESSLAMEGLDATVGQIVKAVDHAILAAKVKKEDICGIGMGVPGQHKSQEGIVLWSPNFKDWGGVNLLEPVHRQSGLPVWMGNDVNVAALGEYRFGAAKNTGVQSMLMYTLGTGIGGGIIINGELWAGCSEGAGELGHVIINAGGPIASCGHSGCLEAMAGAQAIITRAAMKIQQGRGGLLYEKIDGDISKITPRLISECAEAGDALSAETLQETGYWIGIGIASAVNALNPEMVVIGGRISQAGHWLWDTLVRTVRANVIRGSLEPLKIEHAALGDNAGIMGGVVLVLNAIAKSL